MISKKKKAMNSYVLSKYDKDNKEKKKKKKQQKKKKVSRSKKKEDKTKCVYVMAEARGVVEIYSILFYRE